MASKNKEIVYVQVGDGVVSLRKSGQSQVTVANILGVDRDEAGAIKTIYLDRLVHRINLNEFEGWNVSGAVSTILHRQMGTPVVEQPIRE